MNFMEAGNAAQRSDRINPEYRLNIRSLHVVAFPAFIRTDKITHLDVLSENRYPSAGEAYA